MKNLYISFCGIIGAGKTTCAELLGEKLNLPVYREKVADNPYLDLFYGDQEKYAFPLQVHLLSNRFRQQQQILWSENGAVQDRSIYEDTVFVDMLNKGGILSDLNTKTYYDLFQDMSKFMKSPNVIVFLDVTPETALRRVLSRNREMEKKITLEYMKNLYKAYDRFIKRTSPYTPFFIVDNNIDGEEEFICKKILEGIEFLIKGNAIKI